MNLRKLIPRFLSLALVPFFLLSMGCSKDNDNNSTEPQPKGDCDIILFDGDHFKEDSIVIEGSGEYADLSNLPHSDKDWNDEADSFIAGKNAIATFYSEPNFKGDSMVYEAGAREVSVSEAGSIKIRCQQKMHPMDDQD